MDMCVGVHVYSFMCWSWRISTERFLKTKQTHTDSLGIITVWQRFSAAHSKACLSDVSHPCPFWIHCLVLLFQSWTSNLCALCATVLDTDGLIQVSLLCSFTVGPPAALTCSTCSSFSSSVFPLPLSLLRFMLVFTVVRRWPTSLYP